MSALVEGTVISLGSNGGIYVYNKELDKTFYYAHLNQIDVKKNQDIKAGQQIGLSGDAGSPGSPHLHFAVSPGKTSTWVDPKGGIKSYDGTQVKNIVKSQTLNPLNVFLEAKARGLTKLGSLGTGSGNSSKNSVATNNNFANSSNSGTFPYIEITSVADSSDGDTILTPGGVITIKGKSRDIENEIVKIYLGDNLLFGEITIDGENFVRSFKVPINISEGIYQLKARIPDRDIDIYGLDIHIQDIPPAPIDYKELYIKESIKELFLIDKSLAAASTTWNMTAEEMLAKYKSFLISAAAYYGIDGRAIAGAIRWEYEKNKQSRERDLYAYSWVESTGSFEPFKGTGWGKVHAKTARKILAEEGKNQSNEDLAKILALAPTAIDLIAKEMRRAAKAYDSQGFKIYDKPEILTTLYRLGEEEKTYEQRARETKSGNRYPAVETQRVNVNDCTFNVDPPRMYVSGIGWVDSPPIPVGAIFVEPMGLWVQTVKDSELAAFKTV